jgi:signal transduction histidine kinase/DNA-binding LacI/PurR family transcriptional regulator/DNA-binding response OmpR family regulator
MTRRIRLGVFVNDLLSPYQIRLFNSLKRAAEARGVRLIGFQGSYLVNPEQERRTAFDGSFVYGLAGEESVDGLIIASNVLSSRAGSEAVYELCRKTRLPIVCVGRLSGVPSIEIGAREALRAVVEHLVQAHGRRRIAFIQGAPGNPDSIERECVVRTVLKELNVPLSDQFVLPGDFLESSGATAIRTLFDRRGASLESIDAVVASNDQMAVGAMHELAQRGLRVPRDVSIVGFDDDDFARSANPPLTTVSQPIELIGEKALATILCRLKGDPVPARTILDASPVWRRSCGCCSPRYMRGASADPSTSLASAIEYGRNVCLERVQRLAGTDANTAALDAVIRSLQSETEDDLDRQLQELESHILEAASAGVDPLHWHDLLLPLSDELERRATSEGALGRRMDRQMRQVSLLINEVAARIRALDQLHTMQWANDARVFANALLCVRHVRSLASVLKAGLPSLGIRYCCVCLFVGVTEPRIARVAALYNPSVPPPAESPRSAEQLWLAVPGSVPPDAPQQVLDGSVFPAFELVHPQLRLSSADGLNLSVYPLVHAHATLGYVVFDAPSDGTRSWLLEGLAGSLSSAVYAVERNTELLRAREVAERANAAKTEFVAMISHEVRTPLTAIMGHIDLCLQTKLSTEQSHHLVQVRNSSRSLLGIVNDILDFSRIEAQKIELELVPLALDDVLDQVVATCASTANRKGLHLIVDVDVDVPKWIRGDPLRLTQVLLNLVGNAIKFSSHGNVRVAVERTVSDQPGDVALNFLVQDDGIGMRPDEIARVFEPFAQGDGSMTRRYGGTGLGLTISRRLIMLMHGELSVTSQPGKGSQFVFDAQFKLQDANAAGQPSGHGKTVLIVENHALLCQSIERLLKSHGFQVTSVTNAESALETLARANGHRPGFDLLICDYDLPDINACYLLRRVATEAGLSGPNALLLCPPDIDPCLTVNSELPNLVAVVYKPFQRGHLLQAIAKAMATASSQRPDSRANLLGTDVLPPGTRILLIQDDATSREVVREMLKRAGATVSVAGSGEEGINLVAHQSFDLIFQDLHLPGIDGYDTVRAIRNLPHGSQIPIVALSASPMRNSLERCLAAGINDFLVAPVEVDTLLKTARLWIGGEAMAPPLSQRFNSVTYSGEPQRPTRVTSTPNVGAELDVDRALRRLAGDAAIYLTLLSRFVSSHEHTAQQVRLATEQGNLGTAILSVHSLASAAANIGATWLHEVARLVEVTLRDGDATYYAGHLTDLELAESKTMRAIEAILSARVTGDCPTLEPDGGNISEVLNHLRVLIEEHDTAVFDELARLKSILGAKRTANEAFRKLESSINAYDFEQAREHFEAVARWIAHCDKLFCSMN